MKLENRIKKIFVCLLLISMILGDFSLGLFADDGLGSIKLTYLKEAKVTGVEFNIYKVADYNGSKFVGTGTFANYNNTFNFNPNSSSGWNSLAFTASSYIARDNIASTGYGYTDSYSELKFNDLQKGLYLVIAKDKKDGKFTYKANPFFVVLPKVKDGVAEYDISAKPKYTTKEDKPGGGGGGGGGGENSYVRRKALKVWRGDDPKERPKSIQVQLLKNGAVVDTEVLSEDNNWKASWDNLPAEYSWVVVEKDVADGYNVSLEKEGMTIVLTNSTPDDDIPEDDTPRGKKEPDPDPDPDPDIPDEEIPDKDIPEGSIPDEEIPEPEIPFGTIPNTGVLWWPVPILLGASLVMFVLGFIRKHN